MTELRLTEPGLSFANQKLISRVFGEYTNRAPISDGPLNELLDAAREEGPNPDRVINLSGMILRRQRERKIDEAVVQGFWSQSAFGVTEEVRRMLQAARHHGIRTNDNLHRWIISAWHCPIDTTLTASSFRRLS